MQKADRLLRTKLHLPATRPKLVPRPRLQEQIAQGLSGPLTLITAPAGFGKTTLVAASVAACGRPVAWLSLDKDDNQAGRFLSYLVAALQEADPTIGGEAAQLAAGAPPALPDAILTSLINDLDAAAREMVLVLDDYQFISSPGVHAATAFLLDHQPSTFHLVIATRSDPPLPLARLRARGQTVELRAAELRFAADEAAQFLNNVMGLRLEAGAVAALEERTEGWIAGLQMAALSMRDHGDIPGFIKGFSGTNRFILDYLLEEVLASQPPEIQRFLLCTSILERLTAPLCDVLLANPAASARAEAAGPTCPESPERSQSAAILDYLERASLFLMPLDDGCCWYRYHHLFADLLRTRLHQTQPGLPARLHIRASAWLEQKGLIPEAMYHLFAAQEMAQAADLVERYGPDRLAEGDPSVFQMADSLPLDLILARPRIGVYQVWLLIIQGHIPKALSLLDGLARRLAGAGPHTGQPWMQTIIASAQAFLAPPAGAPEIHPLPEVQRLDEIPPEEPILRNAVDYLYGMTLARRGELDRAVEIAIKCIQREKAPRQTLALPTLAPFLTRIYVMQGRLHAAAALCRECLDPLKERGIRFVYTSGSMKIDLGEVLFEWNRLDESEQSIRDGLRGNEPWQNIMTDSFGLIALVRVLLAKGDYTGALPIVEKFEHRLQAHSRPREFEEAFRTLRIRWLLASGDRQTTARWADEIQLSEGFRLHPEYYGLTLARIRLAQGEYAGAQEMLACLPATLMAGGQITRQLETNLLRAAALAGQQHLPDALELIEACLALAKPEGYIRIFLDIGEPARDLLAAYLRTAAPQHERYAQKLLEAFSLSRRASSAGRPPDGLIEPLSERELEVLQLMALGKTNQEIARQLIVAAGTIKAHAATIYRKLDVANRTEAVARARQLGILP